MENNIEKIKYELRVFIDRLIIEDCGEMVDAANDMKDIIEDILEEMNYEYIQVCKEYDYQEDEIGDLKEDIQSLEEKIADLKYEIKELEGH